MVGGCWRASVRVLLVVQRGHRSHVCGCGMGGGVGVGAGVVG